jgi:hypothetical protein
VDQAQIGLHFTPPIYSRIPFSFQDSKFGDFGQCPKIRNLSKISPDFHYAKSINRFSCGEIEGRVLASWPAGSQAPRRRRRRVSGRNRVNIS